MQNGKVVYNRREEYYKSDYGGERNWNGKWTQFSERMRKSC